MSQSASAGLYEPQTPRQIDFEGAGTGSAALQALAWGPDLSRVSGLPRGLGAGIPLNYADFAWLPGAQGLESWPAQEVRFPAEAALLILGTLAYLGVYDIACTLWSLFLY